MELKEFIKTTLRELSQAIDESGVELDKRIAITNTVLRTKGHGDYGLVDFDLALDVKEINKSGGGGGIKISVVKAELSKGNEMASSATSRIKFTLDADFNSTNAQEKAKRALKTD